MYSYTIIKSNSNILWLISIMISIVCAILLKYYTKLLVYLYEKIHDKCMNKKLESYFFYLTIIIYLLYT